jgi:hypothetical protein
MSTRFSLSKLKDRIISNLSDDLLSKDWLIRKKLLPSCDPTFGHCYLATETAYHILGGKKKGWKPMYLKCKDGSHWYLLHSSGYIFDVTQNQFEGEVIPYHKAVGKGFLTKKPSKRAVELIARIYKN